MGYYTGPGWQRKGKWQISIRFDRDVAEWVKRKSGPGQDQSHSDFVNTWMRDAMIRAEIREAAESIETSPDALGKIQNRIKGESP